MVVLGRIARSFSRKVGSGRTFHPTRFFPFIKFFIFLLSKLSLVFKILNSRCTKSKFKSLMQLAHINFSTLDGMHYTLKNVHNVHVTQGELNRTLESSLK